MKKQIIYFVIFLQITFGVIILSGCNLLDTASPAYTYEGHVFDFVTREPIEETQFEVDLGVILDDGNVTTDEQGYFQFTYRSLFLFDETPYMIMDSIGAEGYGTLTSYEIYQEEENIIYLNEPNSIYGQVLPNDEDITQIIIENGDYQATVDLNENREFAFYDVPLGIYQIYAFNGKVRSNRHEEVRLSQINQSIYVSLSEYYIQFPNDVE